MKSKIYFVFLFSVLFVLVFSWTVIVGADSYVESPFLHEKVENGDLPSLEERLPDEPFVIGPGTLIASDNLDWQPGRHGGTMRTITTAPNWCVETFVANNQSLLTAPGIETDNIQGDILKGFEVNEDNTEFVFNLREGLKWSDGVEVTTEDIRFTYEDVLMNEKLTPTFPAKYSDPSGEPMKLEIIDDYTFKISFSEPYGQFLAEITIRGWVGYNDILKPKHYLKQFHADYTPIEEMKDDLEGEELTDEWWDLFDIKDITNWEAMTEEAIGFPVLNPWKRVESPSEIIRMERNPYYHAVDTEGKQLPYIDKIESFEVSNMEIGVMRVISGEVDLLGQPLRLNLIPALKQGAKDGKYKVTLLNQHGTPAVVYLNYTYDDPQWRKVVNDNRFREALNLSIDREDLNDTLYFGLGSKTSIIPSEFNPAKAEQLLDEMGMSARDEEGYRLGPDGEEFELFFEVAPRRPDNIPATQIFVRNFQDIGLRTNMKQISNELRAVRATANELKATIEYSTAHQWEGQTDYSYIPPFFASSAGVKWGQWYNSNGKQGERPPEYIIEIFNIHENILKTVPGSEERQKLIDEMFAWYYEFYPFLITLDNVPQPLVTSSNMGNVPHSDKIIAAEFSARQFFFEE